MYILCDKYIIECLCGSKLCWVRWIMLWYKSSYSISRVFSFNLLFFLWSFINVYEFGWIGECSWFSRRPHSLSFIHTSNLSAWSWLMVGWFVHSCMRRILMEMKEFRHFYCFFVFLGIVFFGVISFSVFGF